eukprot:jgi/Psemu1/196680/e_gw1.191.20.1
MESNTQPASARSESNSNNDDGGITSAQEQDAKTQAQMDAINDEIKASQKLTSDLMHIFELSKTFANGNESNTNGFLQGCSYLETQYTNYRAVRGDGNCYYRAFLFALVENLCKLETNRNELERIRKYVHQSIEEVVKSGYDRSTIEMFHDEIVDLLDAVTDEKEKGSSSMSSSLHKKLNEENATSDYCVWYLRVITSVYLKSDPNRFIHFLDDPSYVDVATYCSREIEPMGKECSMVGVLALAEAFQICVAIEYLDGRPFDEKSRKLTRHYFGDKKDGISDLKPTITLLYRPGHYDILYK